jgi:hypothetical protein
MIRFYTIYMMVGESRGRRMTNNNTNIGAVPVEVGNGNGFKSIGGVLPNA